MSEKPEAWTAIDSFVRPHIAANLIREQHAENERRDAERYRWMKQNVKRIPPAWDLVGWDAAIDAAMQEVPR